MRNCRLPFLGVLIALMLNGANSRVELLLWPKALRWEEGPPGLHYRVAFGSLTVLRSNGQLVRINCQLMRDDPPGLIMFNLKIGYSVYLGTWKRVGQNHIEVESRLVAREKLAVAKGKPSALPGPIIREDWKLRGGETLGSVSSIETPEGELVPAPPLQNPVEFEKLVRRYAKATTSK